jgi:hypothetical protein
MYLLYHQRKILTRSHLSRQVHFAHELVHFFTFVVKKLSITFTRDSCLQNKSRGSI